MADSADVRCSYSKAQAPRVGFLLRKASRARAEVVRVSPPTASPSLACRRPQGGLDMLVYILVLTPVALPDLLLIHAMRGRHGEGSHFTPVDKVNAGRDQSAAVSEDAKAYHGKGSTRVSHEVEQLVADSFAQAQRSEGKGNDRGKENQRHHQVVLGKCGRHLRCWKEHFTYKEEGQHVQRMADHGEA